MADAGEPPGGLTAVMTPKLSTRIDKHLVGELQGMLGGPWGLGGSGYITTTVEVSA